MHHLICIRVDGLKVRKVGKFIMVQTSVKFPSDKHIYIFTLATGITSDSVQYRMVEIYYEP